MQVRKGYLILENIISITITGVIVTTLCAILFSALNLYSKTCSTIEIQQQGLELQNHIERELNENIEINNEENTPSNNSIVIIVVVFVVALSMVIILLKKKKKIGISV
mgnify:CR=1 FL=1